MKRTMLMCFLVIAMTAKARETKKKEVVNFDSDKYELSDRAKTSLIKMIESLDLTDDYTFEISGHTDNAGSNNYNDQLSLRRAESVRSFLINEGIDAHSIVYDFFGEKKPLLNNSNAEHMRKNRRVEVVYRSYYFKDEVELFDSLSSTYKQVFYIDPSKDNEILSLHGIQFNIPANSFISSSGEIYSNEVAIKLKEGMDYESFLAHDLSTISNGELIESDGMFEILAEGENGEALELGNGSTIQVDLPTRSKKDNMELFVSSDGRNWESTGPIEDGTTKKKKKNEFQLISIPEFIPDRYFVDKSTAPRKPRKPRVPNNPHQPRIESYQPSKSLWSVIFKKKAEEKANERYLAAVDKYHEKMGRFEVFMANYEIKKSGFEENMVLYKKEYNLWLDEQARLSDEYTDEQYKAFNEKWDWAVEQNEKTMAKRREEYIKRREQRLDNTAVSLDSSGSASLNKATSYALEVSNLGWINCDRFLNVSEERAVAVWDNDKSDEVVYVLFPDQRGLMTLNKIEEAYRSNYKIPQYERMIVFALKVTDGKPYIFLHELERNEENVEMQFSKTKFSELKGILRGIRETKTASL